MHTTSHDTCCPRLPFALSLTTAVRFTLSPANRRQDMSRTPTLVAGSYITLMCSRKMAVDACSRYPQLAYQRRRTLPSLCRAAKPLDGVVESVFPLEETPLAFAGSLDSSRVHPENRGRRKHCDSQFVQLGIQWPTTGAGLRVKSQQFHVHAKLSPYLLPRFAIAMPFSFGKYTKKGAGHAVVAAGHCPRCPIYLYTFCKLDYFVGWISTGNTDITMICTTSYRVSAQPI